MRAALLAVGVFVAAGTWAAPASLSRGSPQTPGGRIEPSRFNRTLSATKDLAARFPWPTLAAFQTTLERADSAVPIRQHRSGSTTFVFGPTVAHPAPAIDRRAWEDWTYTTTLLAMDRPLYESLERAPGTNWRAALTVETARLAGVKRAMKRGADAGLAEIRAALAARVPLDEFEWEDVAAFAQQHGAPDLAVTVFSRHRPVGRCSMDIAPKEAARKYADVCYAAGKLSCFLNLQVQIMGDQFERVAYSSYGEAAHATEASRLRDIGIDVEKFLRGLLYQFDAPGVDRAGLDPWRLARSIHEANLGAGMASFLRAEVARPDLDGFNRLRAAQTLAYLRFQQRSPRRIGFENDAQKQVRLRLLGEIRAELTTLGLPEPAASWVRGFGTD